jgi:hypothetical protein
LPDPLFQHGEQGGDEGTPAGRQEHLDAHITPLDSDLSDQPHIHDADPSIPAAWIIAVAGRLYSDATKDPGIFMNVDPALDLRLPKPKSRDYFVALL